MNFQKITLQQIEYFCAVAKLLSFTEAAKSLYISQPSLSKQIAILEDEIGVQLFLRTKREVRLTPAGSMLYSELSNIFEVIQEAVEKSRNLSRRNSGVLTLGVLEAIDSSLFLPVIIGTFKQKYPDVHIAVVRHSFRALREKLMNGEVDIIFTLSFELDESLKLSSKLIYQTGVYVIMAKSHPLAAQSKITLQDLKHESFLLISRDESPMGYDNIVKMCLRNGFKPNVVKQLHNIDSILCCVELGIGIAFVDSNIRLYNNHLFKMLKIEDAAIDVVMAWRKENPNPMIPLFAEDIYGGPPESRQ